METKGAVPIPYIIALLLGIAVVAIIGYWFFVLSGQTGGELTFADCKTRATTYCAEWSQAGYAVDSETGEPDIPLGWFSDAYPRCTTHLSTLGFSDQVSAADDQIACELIMATN